MEAPSFSEVSQLPLSLPSRKLSNDSALSYGSALSNNSALSYGSEDFEDLEDSVELGYSVDPSFQANTADINEDHGLFPAQTLHENFFLITRPSFGGSKVGVDKSRDHRNDNQIFISPAEPDDNNRDVWPTTSRNRDGHNSQSYKEKINIKENSLSSPSLIADVTNLDSKSGYISGDPTLQLHTSHKQSSLPHNFTSADAVLGNLSHEGISGLLNDDTKPAAIEETAVSYDLELCNTLSLRRKLSYTQTPVQDSAPLSESCSSWSSDDDTDLGDDESDREGHTAKMDLPTKINASVTENQAPCFDTHPLFSKLKHELMNPIMLEFWELFIGKKETIRFDNNIIQNTHISKCNGSKTSSTAEQNTTPTSKTDSSTTSPEKGSETHKGEGRSKTRKRQGEGDDSDNEENQERNPKRPRNLPTHSRTLDDTRKFACPYRKHDAKKYCVQNWRSCALTPLDSVARVKGHLYRHHRIYQCQRCKRLFSNQQEVNDHLKQEDACELSKDVQEDGITNEIVEKLRNIIPDPYFEEIQEDFMQSLNAQQLTDYEEYCRQELPKVIGAELEETINSLEEQLKNQLVELIRNAQDRVFASYRSSLTLPGTNEGSESSPHSGAYEAVFPTSSSQVVATGCQFTSNEPEETYLTQELLFFEPPPSQIDLESRLDIAALDTKASDSEYNDRSDSILHDTTDILSLLTANSIASASVSALEVLPRLLNNRGETNEAENKAANMHLGYDVDKGKTTTDYFDSFLLESGMDFDFGSTDFSNSDMSYLESSEHSEEQGLKSGNLEAFS
ncbi:hypothetical protein EAF04_004010 [Stromatinia cepivora]|nr:hypothetical protein EAF04_004010 [Stromatinia cepivora]